MVKSKLLLRWETARDDLGLEIDAPYLVRISEDVTIHATLRVRNFGARNGMLIITDYEIVRPYLRELQNLGYGFSVFDEPRSPFEEIYDPEDFIHILSDWSWVGPDADKPTWITEPGE